MNNNLSFEYVNPNDDKTIVFLHGWGLSGESFNRIISKLGDDVSILKIDLFGFGKSGLPQKYFDTYEYAYHIFLLIKKLNINQVVLVGHSFGGRLAILLSSVFDIKIEKLFLCASAGLVRFDLINWFKIKKFKLAKWCVKKKIFKEKYLDRFGSRDYKNAGLELRQVMSNVVNQDLSKWVMKINCETTMVWDKNDKETGYWICKKLKRFISTSNVIIYKTGGHFAIFYNVNKFAKLLI